jgi:hypothetical protein
MARITWHFLLIIMVLLAAPAGALPAALVLDAKFQEVHEDNINPLLSGAGRPFSPEDGTRLVPAAVLAGSARAAPAPGSRSGDLITLGDVVAGFSTIAGPGTDLSFTLELGRAQYSRFIGLNATTAGLGSKLSCQFTDMLSFSSMLACEKTWYDSDGLTGNTCGGNFELRQQTGSKFWVGEGIHYERHRARNPGLTFTGRILTIRTGYRFREMTTAVLMYMDLLRVFNDGSRILMRSMTLSAARDLTARVRVLASFEHQRVASDPAAARTGNNIFSLGLGYSY